MFITIAAMGAIALFAVYCTNNPFAPQHKYTLTVNSNLAAGGNRWNDGYFDNVGSWGNWWSATENGSTTAYYRFMYMSFSYVNEYWYYKSYGFSVRCVRD